LSRGCDDLSEELKREGGKEREIKTKRKKKKRCFTRIRINPISD